MGGVVEILLSTFNGARYLPQLFNSVWAQQYSEIWLSVRDDGSSDGTLRLLEEHVSGRPNARLSAGPNLGAGRSFLALIRGIGPETRYAAFCDQDDVWLPGKLSNAVTVLSAFQGPALYCSAVNVVAEDLSLIRVHRRCTRGPSFENALVENIATGCTIVLNRPAIDLLSSCLPDRFLMHDAWCYLVISGCGQVVYDPRPQVLYRLHSSNAIGIGQTLRSEWGGRLGRQLREGHERVLTRQAEELRRLYGCKLHPRAARSLQEFLDAESTVSKRLRYAARGRAHRQRRLDDLIYRLLYVAKRI